MANKTLPVPSHFKPDRVGEVWRVEYETRAQEAKAWAAHHGIPPAAQDQYKICLLLVDVQNTFCIPGFELYVGGRSGNGAVDDNRRLCEFIYRNLGVITQILPTLDTHTAMQIFHAVFLSDAQESHPLPFTLITEEIVDAGIWQFNPAVSHSLGMSTEYGRRHVPHYVHQLKEGGKYDLTIWPYHAMLGGIGHALVSAVEEAVFFYSIARYSQPEFQMKGNHPLTENYSVLRAEVLEDVEGKPIAVKNERLIERLISYDAIIIAGQAKSHCVAWTIEDLLREMRLQDPKLAKKVYLLEDCTSPVVVPGVLDYTDQADAAFKRFAEAGAHIVRATVPIQNWPGINL